MSVLIEAVTVVVPVAIAELRYPGGLAALARDCPNATFCDDGRIARASFRSRLDAGRFVRALVARGLTFFDGGRFVDVAVVDQQTGCAAPCDWLAVSPPLPDGYRAAWLVAAAPGDLALPRRWSPGKGKRLMYAANCA
jgi:hypothetical protein